MSDCSNWSFTKKITLQWDCSHSWITVCTLWPVSVVCCLL